MKCKRYLGVACIDGTCPMALSEEYEERCMDVIKSCEECHKYRGCEDCAWDGTEQCVKAGGVNG